MGGQILDLTEEERDIGVQMSATSSRVDSAGRRPGRPTVSWAKSAALFTTGIETHLSSCTSCMFNHTWNLLYQLGAPGPKLTQMS